VSRRDDIEDDPDAIYRVDYSDAPNRHEVVGRRSKPAAAAADPYEPASDDGEGEAKRQPRRFRLGPALGMTATTTAAALFSIYEGVGGGTRGILAASAGGGVTAASAGMAKTRKSRQRRRASRGLSMPAPRVRYPRQPRATSSVSRSAPAPRAASSAGRASRLGTLGNAARTAAAWKPGRAATGRTPSALASKIKAPGRGAVGRATVPPANRGRAPSGTATGNSRTARTGLFAGGPSKALGRWTGTGRNSGTGTGRATGTGTGRANAGHGRASGTGIGRWPGRGGRAGQWWSPSWYRPGRGRRDPDPGRAFRMLDGIGRAARTGRRDGLTPGRAWAAARRAVHADGARPRNFRELFGRGASAFASGLMAASGRGVRNVAGRIWRRIYPMTEVSMSGQGLAPGQQQTAAPGDATQPAGTQPTQPPADVAGSVRPTGGTPMSGGATGRPPFGGAAADFYAACVRYTPGSGSGAIFEFLDNTTPTLSEALWHVASGYHMLASRCAQDLGAGRGGLDPAVADAMAAIYPLLANASKLAQALDATAHKVHAAQLAQRDAAAGHILNVPART